MFWTPGLVMNQFQKISEYFVAVNDNGMPHPWNFTVDRVNNSPGIAT